MAYQDNPLSTFREQVSDLVTEGERLLQGSSLGLGERAILQRVNGYLLEARVALEELASPTA